MKTILSAIVLIFVFLHMKSQSYYALDTVIIEKYYISDSIDAKDVQYIYNASGDTIIDSLKLEPGSVTYRIYIKLKQGYKLTKIFSDTSHRLKISSTDFFYNNVDHGKSFGKDIRNMDITRKFSTDALDTWMTLGMATSTNLGIPKKFDTDGSILDNIGYLTNKDTAAGIPLTVADGIDSAKVTLPSGWFDSGIKNGDIDSTIFGSMKFGKEFISKNALIMCNGIKGADTSNEILIAQLTTKGELSFEFNIEVADTNNKISRFFAKKPVVTPTSDFIRTCLSFPIPCGCLDPKYVEFNPDYTCSNPDSCHILKTVYKFGCKDQMACNYDSTVDIHVPGLCCYPGLCGGRDISIVCPNLTEKQPGVIIYPNPVTNNFKIELSNFDAKIISLSMYNVYGDKIIDRKISNGIYYFDASSFVNGIYLIRVQDTNGRQISKYLIKN